LNLLFLTFAYLPSTGGVQRSVRNLSVELDKRGHKVTIAADRTWSGIERRGLQKGDPCGVLALDIPVPPNWGFGSRWRTAARDVYNLARLAWICKRRNVNVVHCHLINVDTRYAAALRKFLRVKIVLTLRGNELSTWVHGKPYRADYVREMLRSADVLTALTHAQLDDARAMEPSLHSPMRVIPNPADVERIRASVDRTFAPPAHCYLLFVGRFVGFKSIDTLIEAYHQLIGADPGFPADLILAGAGDLEQPLRQQALAGAAAERILFPGLLPWSQSLRLIEGASFLILPSHESEGCPNVVLEAMALGTPVIVSDNPRLLEMVTPGIEGEVFPRRAAAALRQCLHGLCFEKARRDGYAREGLRRLRERHRFDKIVQEYEEIYRSLT
jgi:glycosyltransferase involved in cell wall biosynthesis